MHDNWWGWAAAFIIFAIVQAWRALFRTTKGANRTDGMARLNAAAQRILKERTASAANPPRSHATRTPPSTKGVGKASAQQSRNTATMQRQTAPLAKSTTPAVIRRSGFLSGGREPVIQRRR
jgi:beta-glucosidase-like glycosyl hydrolase